MVAIVIHLLVMQAYRSRELAYEFILLRLANFPFRRLERCDLWSMWTVVKGNTRLTDRADVSKSRITILAPRNPYDLDAVAGDAVVDRVRSINAAAIAGSNFVNRHVQERRITQYRKMVDQPCRVALRLLQAKAQHAVDIQAIQVILCRRRESIVCRPLSDALWPPQKPLPACDR